MTCNCSSVYFGLKLLLLFRTLEANQIDQILDAMWEKHVKKGEYIIRQGRNLCQ